MDTATETDFVDVPDADALDGWLPRSGVALLFLHDPGCPTSRRASWEVGEVGGEVALLDVRAHPELAGEVERRTGVRHESPQVIVLVGGRVFWHGSHRRVTAKAVRRAVERASGAAVRGGLTTRHYDVRSWRLGRRRG